MTNHSIHLSSNSREAMKEVEVKNRIEGRMTKGSPDNYKRLIISINAHHEGR
jgi:hypothetical protein